MTPYGAAVIFLIVIAVVIAAVMISLRRAKLRAGDAPMPLALSGRGAYTSKPLDLRAGHYRLDYRLSEDWATAVYLVSMTTGDRDLLLYKTGAGAAPFEVVADERALIVVEPSADHVDWRLELRYRAGSAPDIAAGPFG